MVETLGTIESDEIDELSGLVLGRASPTTFFAHNDSGDAARFFAFDQRGRTVGSFSLDGVEAIDWEDIARGPCRKGDPSSCLYIADTGDNRRGRDVLAIHRIVEPRLEEPRAAEPTRARLTPTTISFRYPNGRHDAETLLVHPTTGVITLVTKNKTGPSGIFEIPEPTRPGEIVTAIAKGEMTPPVGINAMTAGDVNPAASAILIRTYTNVFFYPMHPGQAVADALRGRPCVLPAPVEKQGEAIAFVDDGAAYVTASEGRQSTLQRIRFVNASDAGETP